MQIYSTLYMYYKLVFFIMKNHQGSATLTIIGIITILAIGGGIAYVATRSSGNNSLELFGQSKMPQVQIKDTNTNTSPSSIVNSETPAQQGGGQYSSQNYVKLVSGGGQNYPHQATFQFTQPVMISDIIPANVIYCMRSVSVGAENAGFSNPDCNPLPPAGSQWGSVNTTSSQNGFSLKYNQSTNVLVVSDVNTSDPNMGSFFIGCASCSTYIKFTGIRDSSGNLLPDKIIQVY